MELRCFVIRWDDYPNTRYFLKRVVDLYPRFRRILGPDSNIHLSEHLEDIENCFQILGDKPLLVVFSNNGTYSPESFVASSNRQLEQPDEPWQPKSRAGPEVFVCHISIKRQNDGKEECRKVINGFLDRTQCYGIECLSSFVCVCDIEQDDKEDASNTQTDEENVMSIRLCIVGLIQSRTKTWTCEDQAFKERTLKDQVLQERILVNSDKTSPSTRISEILEGAIMVMLDKINSYIHILTPSITLGDFDVVEIVHNESLEIEPEAKEAITNNISIDILLHHWLKMCWGDLTVSFSDQSALILQLSTAFRCVIVPFLSLKYQLPFWLCNTVTHQQLSEKNIMQCVSISSISELKIETKGDSKDAPAPSSEIDARERKRIIKQVLRDINSSLVPAAEKDLQSVERVTETLKKLSFEISGYYRQSSTRRDVPKPWPKLSDDLRSEILRHTNVYGTGIIYGQLEVHLEKVDPETARDIEKLIRSYGYYLPYRVRILAGRGKTHYSITIPRQTITEILRPNTLKILM